MGEKITVFKTEHRIFKAFNKVYESNKGKNCTGEKKLERKENWLQDHTWGSNKL